MKRFDTCCHVRVNNAPTCHVCVVIDQPARREPVDELDADGWHTGTVIDQDDPEDTP